jgi:hypothetical protein
VILDKTGYGIISGYRNNTWISNSYDTHVPLLFYGWHVPKGELHAKKYITQIAPLSQMLKIPFTMALSQVLETLLDK